MSWIEEGKHAGCYIASEGNGDISKDEIKLAISNNLEAGAVLGQITEAKTVTADGGNTGNGTASAVTVGTDVVNGDYVLTCTTAATDGGTFSVATPSGQLLADLTVGVAYTSSHINLTISDGATDFIVGDKFTIDVIVGEYAGFDPVAVDGTQTAVAILFDNTDASTEEQRCVATKRLSTVTIDELSWKTGVTEVQKRAALQSLATKFIIGR